MALSLIHISLRGKVGGTARIIAVLEPRSNTMKMGICKDDLAPSLGRADEVFLLQPAHIPWQVAEVAEACVQPAHWSGDVEMCIRDRYHRARPALAGTFRGAGSRGRRH